MRTRRRMLVCLCATIAFWPGSGDARGQSKEELLELVKSYRARISDIDVTWTYVRETLAEDPEARPGKPIPRSVDRIKQRGTMYLKDSYSWRAGREGPLHFITAFDGEKMAVCDVDRKSANILPSDPRSRPGNWIYQVLKWPARPTRSPSADLMTLIASDRTTVLPERDRVYGVEMVVLDFGDWEKVWLDVEHGGIVRKSEARQSAGGPLLRRMEVPELHDVNGVFLPARIVRTAFASAKNRKALWNTPVWRFTVTIPKDTLRINTGLAKENFQIAFPSGTHVQDIVAGTEYTTDPAVERPRTCEISDEADQEGAAN